MQFGKENFLVTMKIHLTDIRQTPIIYNDPYIYPNLLRFQSTKKERKPTIKDSTLTKSRVTMQ